MTRTILAIVSLATCLLGTGCAEHFRQQATSACTGDGFLPGTPSFAMCMQAERVARQAAAASLAESLWHLQAPKPRRSLSCVSYYQGMYATTECY